MYQYLPDNAGELLLDYTEKVMFVLCNNEMQSLLSGDFSAQPFCMITTERVYLYSCEKEEVTVRFCDIDDVASVNITSKRQTKKLIEGVFCLPLFGLAYLCYTVSMDAFREIAGLDIPHALIAVCFAILAGFTAIGGLIAFIKSFVAYLHKKISVLNIVQKDGTVFSVNMYGTNTGDAAAFEKELRKARAARKANNAELFLY